MHYWSEHRLNKATLHDVLTRCSSWGSATECKSNIPNQITPSISMFYYLFSNKQAKETSAYEPGTGLKVADMIGNPSTAWFGLTFDNSSTCMCDFQAFSGCFLWVSGLQLCSTVMFLHPDYTGNQLLPSLLVICFRNVSNLTAKTTQKSLVARGTSWCSSLSVI